MCTKVDKQSRASIPDRGACGSLLGSAAPPHLGTATLSPTERSELLLSTDEPLGPLTKNLMLAEHKVLIFLYFEATFSGGRSDGILARSPRATQGIREAI